MRKLEGGSCDHHPGRILEDPNFSTLAAVRFAEVNETDYLSPVGDT